MLKQVKFGAKILFAALIWGIAALIAFTAIKIVLNFLQQLFPNMGDFWNMPAGILIAFAVIFLVVLVTLIALKSTGMLKIAPQRMENFKRKYLPLALVSGFVGIGILHGIALVLPGGAIPQIMSYGLATVNILGIISYFVMAAGREKLDSVTIFTTRS